MMNKHVVHRILNKGMRHYFIQRTPIERRYSLSFATDRGNEILEERLNNIYSIGINLPDSRNELNEIAAEKLCQAIDNYEKSDQTAAILYGMGGNFCTGLSKSANGQKPNLMKILCQRKKPIVAALSGYSVNFGFELAILCDIRIMDEAAVAGLNTLYEETDFSIESCERLVAIIGLSKALDLILSRRNLDGREAFEFGFSNKTVSIGSSIGGAISAANCMSKYLSSSIIADREKIYSAALKRK